MTPLVLHEQTQKQLQAFIDTPSHAVLLHGPPGGGKGSAADYLAARALGISLELATQYPYLHRIDAPAISSEAIEAVRKLEHFLSLRVPKPGDVNRVVIITDAQALSAQAQNALLKTIEEPPIGTLIILTAHKLTSVLPTISSRVQSIAIKKPTQSALHQHFIGQGKEPAVIDQVHSISGGLPGLMAALLSNDEHPLRPATATARELLQASTYERLLMADDFTKRKDHFENVLFILQQMAHTRLQSTTGDQFKRWQQILQASYEAAEQLAGSAQPKLVVDTLMLKLN